MNDLSQHTSSARNARLLRELTRPTAPDEPRKHSSQKRSVASVGASLFLVTFVGLVWVELGPIVENPQRTVLTSDVAMTSRVSDATDPSLPAAASALQNGVEDADAASAPTF